jgi:glycosyltransferase involved in cell wall biosynthesis
MNTRLRIAMVAPVATSLPPVRSGSVETMTSLLTEGLVGRGHEVTLFATASSKTTARLHATFEQGYNEDSSMWPWEFCELLNLTAAIERATMFDIIHYQAEYSPIGLAFSRLTATPIVQTIHHAPSPPETALWAKYPEARFVAVSQEQRRLLARLNVVGVVPHGIDTDAFAFQPTPSDYLLFLGRFTEGKGILQAIEIARRTGMKLMIAAAENDYYRETVAPLVDGRQIIYIGEVDQPAKVALLGGARALLYPVQAGEPFGLVLAEAAACGTPAAALDRGAVRELVEPNITGEVFASVDALVDGLPRVLTLDRAQVRASAVARLGLDRMVEGYLKVYSTLARTSGLRMGSTA